MYRLTINEIIRNEDDVLDVVQKLVDYIKRLEMQLEELEGNELCTNCCDGSCKY